jgi:hypothetical protein
MTANIEASLRSLAKSVPEEQLRAIACDICLYSLSHFTDPIINELLAAGRARSIGNMHAAQVAALRERSERVCNSLYPGYGDPSELALAVGTAGELAFTDSGLLAAINSTEFVAEAAGKLAASTASDGDYDAIYESAYSSERARQFEYLKCYFIVSDTSPE